MVFIYDYKDCVHVIACHSAAHMFSDKRNRGTCLGRRSYDDLVKLYLSRHEVIGLDMPFCQKASWIISKERGK